MDDNPVPGTSGLQKQFNEPLNELTANDEAISRLLEEDLLESEQQIEFDKLANDNNDNKDEDDEEEEAEYDVEDIRAKRRNPRTGMLEYLVKWMNYPESQNTWEPIDNLKCPDIIARFNETEKNKRKRRNTSDSQQLTPAQQKRPRTKISLSQSQTKSFNDNNNNVADDINGLIEVTSAPLTAGAAKIAASSASKNNIDSQSQPPQKTLPTIQKQSSKPAAEEPLLLEDIEQDNNSTGTLSSNGKNTNGLDYVENQRARNFLLKGFDRRLPLEKIVGASIDDENKLWFFVKWKELTELELIDADELERKEPRALCTWYRERLYYAVNNPSVPLNI